MEAFQKRVESKLGDTLAKLRELWDQIGICEEERQRYLDDLGIILDELLEDAVVTTETRLRDMVEEVAQAEKDLQSMSLKLGNGPVDTSSEVGDDKPAVLRRDNALARLSEMRDVFSQRQSQLQTMKEELVELWTALGDPVESQFENVEDDLSASKVADFEDRLTSLNLKASKRREDVMAVLRRLQSLMHSLKVPATSMLDRKMMGAVARHEKGENFDMDSDDCIGISAKALEIIQARVDELKVLESERRGQLTVLGEEISKLYDRLSVSDEEQAEFAGSVHGLGEDTIAAGQHELNRLQDLLISKLSEIVSARRQTMIELWDEMGSGPEERAQHEDVMSGDVSEELLEKAEEAVAKLQAQAQVMRPILKHIDRRNELLRLRQSHAEQMKDPEYQALLTGRSRQARLALKELEATEKAVKKELPKITEALRRRVGAWETNSGKTFVYQDRRYLDRLEEEEHQWEEARQQEKRDKETKKKAARQPIAGRGPILSHSVSRGDDEKSGRRQRPKAQAEVRVFTAFVAQRIQPLSFSLPVWYFAGGARELGPVGVAMKEATCMSQRSPVSIRSA
mmetsp:Transcript_13837/g.51643  ORF Transcript_13837/g.51643 Transcript_13837/m.51643 type:complete len:570 (-) Transcript_13837:530-2239(-)